MKLSDRLIAMAASNMWSMQEVGDLLEEAAELSKRYEDAATGECVEVGDLVDCDGHPFIGAIIESTREELKLGPGIVYKRVRIVLDKEG